MIDMQDSTITVLDERDHEFIQKLRNLGAPRNLAHVIAYLKNVNEATSREVERGAELGYTGVTTALQALQEMSWIEAREFKRVDGRRKVTYSLKSSLEEIVMHFDEEKRREFTQEREAIQRLKELANSKNTSPFPN